ncbi:chorismate mutase [Streptomyces ochraceiscleroticus]|uniref:chorismate mutase n=1 Tax=Streptomyces ochraceiscleroticus TaxID=47761 RepID=A0ABW1MPG3_9ACTN|nr:chorismate mutase [Streptomyces ochraceiscleroticus]
MPLSSPARRGAPRRVLIRRALVTAAAATVLCTGAPGAVAAPAAHAAPSAAQPGQYASQPGPYASHPGQYAALRPIAALSAERLATADLVAAAKWGTGSPIDDPAREQQVLDAVAQRARELGADPDRTVAVFRDQIEANKIVQRGLHRRWAADPAQAPTTRPDLNEVRKEINRINEGLVRAIADSAPARRSPSCIPVLTVTSAHVVRDEHLDPLHTIALARAVRSVCDHVSEP